MNTTIDPCVAGVRNRDDFWWDRDADCSEKCISDGALVISFELRAAKLFEVERAVSISVVVGCSVSVAAAALTTSLVAIDAANVSPLREDGPRLAMLDPALTLPEPSPELENRETGDVLKIGSVALRTLNPAKFEALVA